MSAYYSEEIIQEVIEANDIVDIVSDYMTLKRSGNSLKGKCPFHNEKTASFTVSREKQLYHCFGCGVGGNVITFVMETEKLPFIEALKFLADRANIILPEKADDDHNKKIYEKKLRLYDLQKESANYYYKALKANYESVTYFNNRGISYETIKKFGLGYASYEWDSMLNFLKSKGYTIEEMVESGLIMVNDKKNYYDRFRNRLMFPILNPRNQIIGFGGRIIDEKENGPKYLNSPETIVFSKSYELYNLNRCKNHIENGQIVIVEGYMDVISLYEKGVKNTVAALGTAFTQFHGKILERYATEVIIAFDGDKPGQLATEKAMNILKNNQLNVKILVLPESEDPDSFIQKYGLEDFNQAISNALTAIEYELFLLKKRCDLNHTDGRLQYGNQSITVLTRLKTSVEIDYYSKLVAKDTGINATVIRREVLRLKNNQIQEPMIDQIEKKKHEMCKIPKAYAKAQEIVIQYCLKSPEMIENVPKDDLTNSFYSELLSFIQKERIKNNAYDIKHCLNHFDDSNEVQKIVGLLIDEEKITQDDFSNALEIMKRFHQKDQMHIISDEIKRASSENNMELVAKLTNDLIAIKKLTKEYRGQ